MRYRTLCLVFSLFAIFNIFLASRHGLRLKTICSMVTRSRKFAFASIHTTGKRFTIRISRAKIRNWPHSREPTVSPVPRVECHFAVEFHWIFQGGTSPDRTSISALTEKAAAAISNRPSRSNSALRKTCSCSGLQYLVLRANTQDASMMHDRLAMAFFRKLGMPAPREVNARLYINDQYSGVYSLVEDVVDQQFLQRNFGQTNGNPYSYEYTFPWNYGSGSDSSKYSPLPYKPQNHATDYNPGPIVDMVRAINETPDAQFSAALSQYVDTKALFTELAEISSSRNRTVWSATIS